MAKQPIKLISLSAEQLVEYLDKTYPPRCILPTETAEAAHRYAGRRDLIDVLIVRMKQEKEKNDRSTQISVR